MTNTLLSTAVSAALEAGKAILNVYETDFSVQHKEDTSPLTKADQASHDIISRHLQATSIPILSEEGSSIPFAHRKDWKKLWIVDPLDGTKEFIKRNGEFTVNIALIQDRTPILGVIFIPVKRTLYLGSTEYGARRCQDIHPDLNFHLEDLLEQAAWLPENDVKSRPFTIVGSRSHPTPELQIYVQEKERELGEVQFVSAGSSLKFCLVAEGQADIYPRLGPTMEWDTAAGQAIAQAAGRRVRIWDSDAPLVYNKEDLHNPWFLVE
ncbi:MAG: 3'(2'),5'-bisphosphate nucleotidase CysQ [Thermodesulfobacteriota bacterium]